jgi:beta-galactosidase
MYLRWRPLLDGDLFGAFGPYGMDGSKTDRSRAVSASCTWITAAERQKIFASKPVKGQIGIIYVPETEVHTWALRRSTDPYTQSAQGVYQGFFDQNIQADWVHIDDISGWDTLYLPYPVMLSSQTIAALTDWVKGGGTLISEGCPAYFSDNAHAGAVQPGFGMDELFGVTESYVEFTPDLLGDLTLTVAGDRIWGGEYLQCYTPTTGEAVGWYDDGRIAAVDNRQGKGKTRLIGTMPGYGYALHGGAKGNYQAPPKAETAFFEGILAFVGQTPRVHVTDQRIIARLHQGAGGTYLWIANPKRQDIPVRVEITGENYAAVSAILGPPAAWNNGALCLTAPARQVIIYELK